MKVDLNYGKGKIAVTVDDKRVAGVLRQKPGEIIAHPDRALLAALDHPIGCGPLRGLCGKGKRACVVVSDITRPVPHPVVLPVLLHYLEAHQVKRSDISILIATGMHRPCEGPELVELLGEKVATKYRIVNHNPSEEKSLKQLGVTSRGTKIRVNRLYLDADIKILTGLIEPHFMAGYSGGRKAICPGISGIESLQYSHGVECLGSPQAVSGVLAGNPFHEEALEVAKAAGADFLVNFVIGEDRGIMGIFAGDLVKAHERGCAFVDEHFQVPLEEPADIVLTSNAGYPLDINFYQTVKGLVAALPALKKEGILKSLASALPSLKKDSTIIIVSRCSEGVGSERFVGLLKELKGMKKPADFLAAHKNNFVPDQWEVQELIKVLDKAKFQIYSEGLSSEDAELCAGEKIDSIEKALEAAFKRHGRRSKVVIIPEGPYLMPVQK